MKIAILGTRGIPNNHGGYEQFAEYFSSYLAKKAYEIYVYNSSLHPYKKNNWKGVHIIHCYDPEDKIGTFGQFIYDLNCILDIRKRNFDIVFQLGYTSSTIWNWLIPKRVKLVTNMDGLEWKRSKYSKPVQHFLKYAEKLAVKHSDILIADSKGIQQYLMKKYNVNPVQIAYGVETNIQFNDSVFQELGVKKHNYNMLIARMETENNIETILNAISNTEPKNDFLVIGNTNNSFGKHLIKKFRSKKHIRFIGALYDLPKLNSLRKNSILYFHGHSVGGTNPSLLEAMASKALICAHDNVFNRSILKNNAFYFKNENDILRLVNEIKKDDFQSFIENNFNSVTQEYSWDIIHKKYEKLI